MIGIKSLCREALQTMIHAGALPAYTETGQYRPEVLQERHGFNTRQQLVFHYADLSGPLYSDRDDWGLARAIVQCFTQSGADRGEGKFTLPAPWGDWPVSYQAMLEVVPEVMQALGYTRAGGRRVAEFTVADECLMEALPEPYGKWFQHAEHRPRWGERVKLSLKVNCTLTSTSATSTRLDIGMSGFAPRSAKEIAERLALEFELPVPDWGATYLAQHASLVIDGQPVDLGVFGHSRS